MTGVGFVVTWIQLKRTSTAREAVDATVTRIDQETAGERLRTSLPRLRATYVRARDAAHAEDHDDVRRNLEAWSSQAERCIQMLGRLRPTGVRVKHKSEHDLVERLIDELRRGQALVRESLSRLERRDQAAEAATRYARKAMLTCADTADALSENRRYRKAS